MTSIKDVMRVHPQPLLPLSRNLTSTVELCCVVMSLSTPVDREAGVTTAGKGSALVL